MVRIWSDGQQKLLDSSFEWNILTMTQLFRILLQPLQMLILHNSFKYKLIYNNGNKQTTSQQLLTLYWPNFLGWLLGLLVPYHWIQIRLKIAVTYIGENWFYWIFVFHEPRRLALSVSKKNKLKGACLKSYCTVQYC